MARTGEGLQQALGEAVRLAGEGRRRVLELNYGADIDEGLRAMCAIINREGLLKKYAAHWIAVKLMEEMCIRDSRGPICHSLTVEEAARQYVAAGAGALSILTERRFFAGELDFLERAAARCLGTPLLRKDFIFDPLQVRATAATPAAALLLIVALTPDAALLRRLREQAESLGMQAVVEVCGSKDLALARESGARIIQVLSLIHI